jgi:hypothetical protein
MKEIVQRWLIYKLKLNAFAITQKCLGEMFLIFKEIWKESSAKSYMKKDFLCFEGKRHRKFSHVRDFLHIDPFFPTFP